uniref:Uncharacterized protein n=1 Tax=Caenorhabditis tropicalis TaxID=1561998 RepID=A0A1I7UUS0_9PELO
MVYKKEQKMSTMGGEAMGQRMRSDQEDKAGVATTTMNGSTTRRQRKERKELQKDKNEKNVKESKRRGSTTTRVDAIRGSKED